MPFLSRAAIEGLSSDHFGAEDCFFTVRNTLLIGVGKCVLINPFKLAGGRVSVK